MGNDNKEVQLPSGERIDFWGFLYAIAEAVEPIQGAQEDTVFFYHEKIMLPVRRGEIVITDAYGEATTDPQPEDSWIARTAAIDCLKRYDLRVAGIAPLDVKPQQDISGEVTTQKPWLIVQLRDPAAVQDWYTPARYFARQLVINDSTLLAKKAVMAEKVSKLLFDVGIKKRGGVKALAGITICKSFSNLNWD